MNITLTHLTRSMYMTWHSWPTFLLAPPSPPPPIPTYFGMKHSPSTPHSSCTKHTKWLSYPAMSTQGSQLLPITGWDSSFRIYPFQNILQLWWHFSLKTTKSMFMKFSTTAILFKIALKDITGKFQYIFISRNCQYNSANFKVLIKMCLFCNKTYLLFVGNIQQIYIQLYVSEERKGPNAGVSHIMQVTWQVSHTINML